MSDNLAIATYSCLFWLSIPSLVQFDVNEIARGKSPKGEQEEIALYLSHICFHFFLHTLTYKHIYKNYN